MWGILNADGSGFITFSTSGANNNKRVRLSFLSPTAKQIVYRNRGRSLRARGLRIMKPRRPIDQGASPTSTDNFPVLVFPRNLIGFSSRKEWVTDTSKIHDGSTRTARKPESN